MANPSPIRLRYRLASILRTNIVNRLLFTVNRYARRFVQRFQSPRHQNQHSQYVDAEPTRSIRILPPEVFVGFHECEGKNCLDRTARIYVHSAQEKYQFNAAFKVFNSWVRYLKTVFKHLSSSSELHKGLGQQWAAHESSWKLLSAKLTKRFWTSFAR